MLLKEILKNYTLKIESEGTFSDFHPLIFLWIQVYKHPRMLLLYLHAMQLAIYYYDLL